MATLKKKRGKVNPDKSTTPASDTYFVRQPVMTPRENTKQKDLPPSFFVKRDLIKTFVLSGIAFSLELCVYWLVEKNGLSIIFN